MTYITHGLSNLPEKSKDTRVTVNVAGFVCGRKEYDLGFHAELNPFHFRLTH